MTVIKKPTMSAEQLARKLFEEAKRELMLNPPKADSPEKLRREIEIQATAKMRRCLTSWITKAGREKNRHERISKNAWKEREKALAEVEKIKPSVAAYPNDAELRDKLRAARREAGEKFKVFGRAGQAAANWGHFAEHVKGIMRKGLPEKGMSILGVYWGKR